MTEMTEGHSQCETRVRELFESEGVEATVSTAPPLVTGPYTQPGMTCPHGVTYWFEPTGEQLARWAEEDSRPR
jgi:hypothetical protein